MQGGGVEGGVDLIVVNYYNGLLWVSEYATTFLWCFIALWALYASLREDRADRKELKRVTRLQLTLAMVIAQSRKNRADYMLKQAIAKTLIGGMALYTILVFGPRGDADAIVTLALRVFFIYDIYCFLQAKRNDRALRPYVRTMAAAEEHEREEHDDRWTREREEEEGR